MGFWAGVITTPNLYINESWLISELIFYPFITSALCWFADSYITLVHAETNYFNSGSSISSSSSSGSTPNK
jgi:hypothetical protein